MSDASSCSASSSRSSWVSNTDHTSILDAHRVDEVTADVFDTVFHGLAVKDTHGRPFELNQRLSGAVSRLGEAKDLVASTCNVLNRIVHLYESSCNPRGAARVKFVEHSQAVLLHHPHKSDTTPARPHIIAVPEPIASSYNRDVKARSKRRAAADPPAIAWHHVLAAILVNDSYDELPFDHMIDLLGPLHQARPDLPGCFAITATRGACRLWWSDAAGIYTTPCLAWDDPATVNRLLNFVYRLHHPLATDSTISLESMSQGSVDYDQKPVWHVGDGLGGVYRVEHIIAVGQPWTRKNWVAASSEHRSGDARFFTPCSRVIIKDSYPLIDNEAFVEDAILDHLHEAGSIPGVCSPISSFLVTNGDGHVRSVEVPDCSISPRRKHRLVMRSDGEDLYQCPSVLRFVMMMYDLLEVLRYVHEQRGVLHRDISLRNVLHLPSGSPRESFPGCKFASEVLAHKYPQMTASAGPACILIDFDNAFCDGRSPEPALRQPVGTPAFAARNVCRNFRSSSTGAACRFPKLKGSALECYIQAFGQRRYDNLSALLNSTKIDQDSESRERAVHRPHHDAESCYWLTAHFLLTALPRGADRSNDKAKAEELIQILEQTSFGRLWDPRGDLLELSATEWARYLHRDLRPLGALLARLGDAVRPIFDLFEPPPPPYHLHEAMQRILLQEACRLLDSGPLLLDTTVRRSFYSHFNVLPTALQPPQASPSRKRTAEGLEDREGAGSRPRLSL